jgi:parallel beta-helix repeat protein
MKQIPTLALSALALFAATAAHAETLTVSTGQSIQAAVTKAKPGDVIEVHPGVYRETVFIDKENITLRGVRKAGESPLLDGGGKLNDGVLASGHGVVISGFSIRGFKGNGIMTQGANNYKIIDNFVDGGFYGIFPQYGTNGLVARNRIRGVEDAGIYVGMSDNVDVIGNEAWENVIGVESENCRNILLESNYLHDNSAAIAVTLIPGLPVKDASHSTVRKNFIVNNNLKNFAPPSSIAASVPSGVGVLVLGAKHSTIEDNQFVNNSTAAIISTDLLSFGLGNDGKVDPYPDHIRVLANSFVNNGRKPKKPIDEVVKASGLKHVDIIGSGKEREACITDRAAITEIGANRWRDCAPSETSYTVKTAQLAEPLKTDPLTLEQKGRLIYLGVCTGCHAYNTQLHGPSMVAIKALYAGRSKDLAKFAAAPVRTRKDFPEMPPQGYLGDEVLNEVARYILNDLKN